MQRVLCELSERVFERAKQYSWVSIVEWRLPYYHEVAGLNRER